MSQLMAIVQILAVLGTGLGIGLAFATAIALALVGRGHAARLAVVAGVSVAGLYAMAMLFASATSRTQTLASGDSKVFCEIDCHVRFAVTDSRRDRSTLVVTVREYFDETSISERRGDAPLYPGGRRFALVNRSGEQISAVRVRELTPAPLFAPLRPGEKHDAELTFEVPATATVRGLLVESDDEIASLLIGHERSPFHGKLLLSVRDAADASPLETAQVPARILRLARVALGRAPAR